jgi:hypothetical protein
LSLLFLTCTVGVWSLSISLYPAITSSTLCMWLIKSSSLISLGALIHHPKCNAQRDIKCLFFFTHLPIGALLCKVLENLPGLCGWICAWNSLFDWGTLQIIVCVGGVQRWKSC